MKGMHTLQHAQLGYWVAALPGRLDGTATIIRTGINKEHASGT